MFKKSKTLMGIALLVMALALGGCAVGERPKIEEGLDLSELQNKVLDQEREISGLKSVVVDKEKSLEEYKHKLTQAANVVVSVPVVQESPSQLGSVDSQLLPPNAAPGECYSRTYIPPKYETVKEKVLKKPAAEKIELIPAKYEWVTEKVLLKPAHTVWKKGRGPVEKVSDSTGEIMCLVDVPAKYKTVKKRVMVEPPTTKDIEIPAEYKKVKVRKLVEPPRTKVIPIPAEYETVTKKTKISGGNLEWRRILCETNVSPVVVKQLQRSLIKEGYYKPGKIDGIIGWRTINAYKSYQKKNNLATGSLTYETLEKLGVKLGQ